MEEHSKFLRGTKFSTDSASAPEQVEAPVAGEWPSQSLRCSPIDTNESRLSGYQAPPAGLNFTNPELIGDLIDDGPNGAKWLEMFRQYEVEIGAMNRFTDSIVAKTDELLTPVGEKG